MIKPSIELQELRRRIYRKAKAEKTWRFWGLYVHVCKLETLNAVVLAGRDGVTRGSIEIGDCSGIIRSNTPIGHP